MIVNAFDKKHVLTFHNSFLKNYEKSIMELTVTKITVFRGATFLNEALWQILFLRNLRNIQHN